MNLTDRSHWLRLGRGFWTTVMALSLVVTIATTSTLAQYQLRKPTTPTQQKASITVTEPAGAATWEKGQRYAIKWQSEGRLPSVKIILIDQAGKSHDIVRSTTNSGSYTYTVSTRLVDGAYRVVVMTVDGSVRDEASGTVTIQKKMFGKSTSKAPPAGGGTAEQPESPAVRQRSLPGTVLPSGQTSTQQGGIQPGDLTATKDEDKDSPGLMDQVVDRQIGDATGISSATTSVVFGNLPIAQVSMTEAAELDRSLLQPVEEPEPSGSDADDSVAILEPQAVDLKCVIRNKSTNNYRTTRSGERRYYFEPSGSRELDFDIAIINDGTSGPITVPILVRLIKKPEMVVIYQMQAGFGDVYPGYWYMTNGAIHWDIRELEENYTSGTASGVDFGLGGYRVIVTADIGNSLGEREELRFDNIDEIYLNIGHN